MRKVLFFQIIVAAVKNQCVNHYCEGTIHLFSRSLNNLLEKNNVKFASNSHQ